MENRFKIILLWLTLIVCMILHFDYHISKAVYGLDIRIKNADGTMPVHLLVVRVLFHFLPLLYITAIMWWQGKAMRIVNFVLTVLYALSHCMHFAGEVKKGDNSSQIILLGISAFLAILLAIASYGWYKEGKQQSGLQSAADKQLFV